MRANSNQDGLSIWIRRRATDTFPIAGSATSHRDPVASAQRTACPVKDWWCVTGRSSGPRTAPALGSDDCVIDGKYFFVRGCIEIPVIAEEEPFSWGVWVSLSEQSHADWVKHFHVAQRSQCGPYFGWLNAWLKPYPETVNLKTHVHLRNNGIRPLIELEPTDHPLAVEQRLGISRQRVAEIYAMMVHEDDA